MQSSVPEKKKKFRRRAAVATVIGVAALAIGIPSASAAQKTFSFDFGNGQSASVSVTYPDDWEAALTQVLQSAPSSPSGSSAPTQSNDNNGDVEALSKQSLVKVPTYIPNIDRAYQARNAIYGLNAQIGDYNTRKQSIPYGLTAPQNSRTGNAIDRLNDAQQEAMEQIAEVTAVAHSLNGFNQHTDKHLVDERVNDLIGEVGNARNAVSAAIGQVGAVNEARATS